MQAGSLFTPFSGRNYAKKIRTASNDAKFIITFHFYYSFNAVLVLLNIFAIITVATIHRFVNPPCFPSYLLQKWFPSDKKNYPFFNKKIARIKEEGIFILLNSRRHTCQPITTNISSTAFVVTLKFHPPTSGSMSRTSSDGGIVCESLGSFVFVK